MDKLYIEKVLAGDSSAFSYFVRTYKDMAFSIALSLTKDQYLAEEVAHEAFIQCYRSLHSFRMQSKFSTWFYRIVVNTAYRALNKKSIKLVEFDLPLHDLDYEDNALNKLIIEERKQLINEVLATMPSNESLALRLFYLEELSLQELCDITAWTITNAKVILHRARKRIYGEINRVLKEK